MIVTGNVPQTYGSFGYTVNVNGPANNETVHISGKALYPAPTNASVVYDPATAQYHFHCDPVPGATKYSVMVIKMGGGLLDKKVATLVFTSNDATFTLPVAYSTNLRFSVTGRNADDTRRSMTTILLPISSL